MAKSTSYSSHTSGLICFRHEPLSKKAEYTAHVICNTSTGQSLFLPKVKTPGMCSYKSFLGFDPIDKVFKVVLSMAGYSSCAYFHNVLTLGTGEMRWRRIQCSLAFSSHPWYGGICINGDLVNYKGKLGVVSWPRHNSCGGVNNCRLMNKMRIWVLEDVVKQDWSEHAYTLPDDKFGDPCRPLRSWSDCHGGNCFAQEVFSNTVKHLEVQGFENPATVHAFVDHVDDLTLNMKSDRVQQDLLTFDMNYHHLQQDVHRFEKINKFAALSLLEDV
ncbi:hypothetical protein N665_0158s0017 [Sinapis alba]|nr:hypothetical protein N665_0158s0017 [Sinapis alba]